MNIAIVIGLCVAGAGILSVVVWYLIKTVRSFEKQRTGIAYVRGIALRFTFWEGVDALQLRHAVQAAASVLCDVWTPWVVAELLNNVHINVTAAESWNDGTQQRVAGIASPGTLTITVDRGLKALAHELAHIVEAGRSRLPPRVEHEGWAERGIYGALSRYDEWLQNNS